MLSDKELQNIQAWAIDKGFDPEQNYIAETTLSAGQLTPHFHEDEFRSNGNGELPPGGMSATLLVVLELVRARFGGKPVRVTSGYRDPAYNAQIGGASNSRHVAGDAADIQIDGVSPSEIYAFLDPMMNKGGLGKYNTFTHIDTRGYRARW